MESKDETRELLDGRASTYGDTVDNAQRVAQMWNAYLGVDVITGPDMMMMMALYKAFRFKVTPDYADNINDVLGYAQIVKDVQARMGGLIEAETAKEYQAKKQPFIDLTPEERISRNLVGDHEPISQISDPLGLEAPDEVEELKESRRSQRRRTAPEGLDQQEGLNMEEWLRNRCGKPTGTGACRYVAQHYGECRA